MTLSLALSNALTGLNVNQRSLSVLSHNIANANTEGYSRQSVEQSARYIDGTGTGVRIDDVTRRVDQYLQRSIQRQVGDVGYADTLDDYMDRIQILIGEPGAENSIDEYVETYFNAMQNLAETPERTSFRAEAVAAADTLARELSSLAFELETLRYQADIDIENATTTINTQIDYLDTLNVAINRAFNLGTGRADLLDQRDLALEELSQYLNINVNYQESGEVQIYAGNGTTLLDAEPRELVYTGIGSVDSLINDNQVSALQVIGFDNDGNVVDIGDELISSGDREDVTTVIRSGSLLAQKDLRDTILPDMLANLDMLASRLRDEVNAIHNDGSGFPGADELTGTREIFPQEAFTWSGQTQITLLQEDGTPVPSPYADEANNGYRPLTLDFDFLQTDANGTPGEVDVQTIIDEINNHYGSPPIKAQLGNLNNIQIVSNVDQIPSGNPSLFSFDFDLENISGEEAGFFVGNVTVVDDTGAAMAAPTETLPAVSLSAANTFQTTNGSNLVTVTSAAPHGLAENEYIYIEDPGGLPPLINGIPTSEFVGTFVQISNVTATTFDIQVASTANVAGPPLAIAGMEARTEYGTTAAGEKGRTRDLGQITADFNLNAGSTYYDITVEVAVEDESGNFETGTITYRVLNNQQDTYGDRVDVRTTLNAATGAANVVFPSQSDSVLEAKLVDAEGNELPKINGEYITSQSGFLQLVVNDDGAGYTVHIDELNSQQLGRQNINPPEDGTNRGFSHYFELNNFFTNNVTTTTGDTTEGSAISLAVEERLLRNPNLVSTGDPQLSRQPEDPDADPLYTYERYIGDNSVAQRIAELGISGIQFDAAGGLDSSTQTFNGYTGETLAFFATSAATAANSRRDENVLLEGFENRADAISGVNLDEELANTIIYQNAYTASTRVITVTGELFADLLGVFN